MFFDVLTVGLSMDKRSLGVQDGYGKVALAEGNDSMMARPGVMGRREVIGLVVTASFTLALQGCDWITMHDTLRYRMTVEVDTPQGLRTGSSVIESTIANGKSWGDASGISYKLQGQAVAIDIAPGQTLFALLRSQTHGDGAAYHAMLLGDALRDGAVAVPSFSRSYADEGGGPFWKEQRSEARKIKPRLDLPAKDYPLLVTFTDISDPASVKLADPADLAARFGPGVRLKRINVEITDDPITTGIEKRLGWLQSHQGSLDYTGRLHPDAPEKDVTRMAFTQGIIK